jgi:hypothetical protein
MPYSGQWFCTACCEPDSCLILTLYQVDSACLVCLVSPYLPKHLQKAILDVPGSIPFPLQAPAQSARSQNWMLMRRNEALTRG